MDQRLYRPADLCEAVGIRQSTYENWKRAGYLDPVGGEHAESKTWRLFTKAEIVRAAVIAELVLEGIPLADATPAAIKLEVGISDPAIGPDRNWWFVRHASNMPAMLHLEHNQSPIPSPDGTEVWILNFETSAIEEKPISKVPRDPSMMGSVFVPLSRVVARTLERLAA